MRHPSSRHPRRRQHQRYARARGGEPARTCAWRRSAASTRRASRRWPSATARRPYLDLEAFLRHRPLDIVAIGSPSGAARRARRRGRGAGAARAGREAARGDDRAHRRDGRAGRTRRRHRSACSSRIAATPDFVALKRDIEAGALGRVTLADARVKWYRPPEYLQPVALARHVGARRRRRADEPGHPYRRSAAVAARRRAPRLREGGHGAARHRGRGHGRRRARVRQRRGRHASRRRPRRGRATAAASR